MPQKARSGVSIHPDLTVRRPAATRGSMWRLAARTRSHRGRRRRTVMATLHVGGIQAAFDTTTGLLMSFTVTEGGRNIAPMHGAPWIDTDKALPSDKPPHMANPGGNFFCAPFCATESDSRFHGWPPNSPWIVVASSESRLRAVLQRPVAKATLIKELTRKDGHPSCTSGMYSLVAREVFRSPITPTFP